MHSHYHGGGTGRILWWSLVATAVFALVEFIAGIQAHSLALLSDAGHNFTDALALLLAWFGFYLQAKPANEVKTFGYHRAGVLTAFININIRSAFVHMLGDLLGLIGIIIGAIVIRYTGWQEIDPLLSILIGVLIIWTAWDIIKESLNILLEGLPRGLELQSVVAAMRGVEGVLDVHDLHIWSLGSATRALSCHVLIEDLPPSTSERTLRRINDVLCDRFHIRHTTVQFEHVNCAVSESGCVIPVDVSEGHSRAHRH